MRGIVPIISVALVAALTLSACGADERPFVGTWVGRRQIPNGKGLPKAIFNTLATVHLTITNDERFTLQDAGVPVAGTVSYEHGDAYLHSTTVMDQALERQDPQTRQQYGSPIRLAPVSDGTLRYSDPGGFDRDGIILSRVAAKTP